MRTPLFQLDEALEPDDVKSYLAELDNLQGNILKSHGRGAALHLFLTFRPGKQAEVKEFLRQFGRELTSAAKQLEQARLYKETHEPGQPFACLYLSAHGYEYLGLPTEKFSQEFQRGMKKADLGDPLPGEWEPKFQRQLDAMLILADDRVEVLTQLLSERRDKLESFAEVGIEFGLTMRNAEQNAIEHFGYADGVSQPIFLKGDLKQTTKAWNPLAGPNLVLVPDPYGGSPTACGTYFVFRKLEQNVREFKAQERALADALKLQDDDRERAGAMVVGRFEDGTPITSRPTAVSPEERQKNFALENDFNYKGDPEGNRCPLSAHIRIVNPRTDDDKVYRIARRGITYGDPTPPDDDLEALPGRRRRPTVSMLPGKSR